MKSKLDVFFQLEEQICKAFGYKQQWRIYSVVDMREFWWHADESGRLLYWDSREYSLARDQMHEYPAGLEWLSRVDGFAMILMDTNCDNNMFLGVFDEAKEVKELAEEREGG